MTHDTGTMTAAAAGTLTIGGDLTVNRLGYGAMRITGEGIWGEPRDRDEAKRVLHRALDLGITFIDTADAYGPDVSERLIAESLYPYPQGLVIATKGGLTRSGPGQWSPDGRPAHLREACAGSLQRLRLDRIDLYQFHRPDPHVPFAESVGTLVDLQREGKIRHIGLSNVSVAQLAEAQGMTTIVSVQNRFNPSDHSSAEVLAACERQGIAFIPWAPLGNGGEGDALQRIAARHHAEAGQIAIAWQLQRSPVILPIPGTSQVAHLEANIAAAGLHLTDDEMRELGA